MARLSFAVVALALAGAVPGSVAEWHHGGSRKFRSCARSQQWPSAQACIDACVGEQQSGWIAALTTAACERAVNGASASVSSQSAIETPSASFSVSVPASTVEPTVSSSVPVSTVEPTVSSSVPVSTVLPTVSVSSPADTNGAVVSTRFVTSVRPSPSTTSGATFTTSRAASTTSRAASTTSRAQSTPVASPSTVSKSSAVVSSSASAPAATGGSVSAADRQQYLDIHNNLRAQHGAVALTWSTELETAAQTWANNCVFEHSGGKVGSFGENLSAGSGSGFGISQALQLWIDEESEYDPSNPQYSHFTQMVWKGTTELGCAVAQCDGIFDPKYGKASFYVCEYKAPGNVIGQFAENVQA